MMLAPSTKDTRPLRNDATQVACVLPVVSATNAPIEDFDPFADDGVDVPLPKSKKMESKKPEKRQNRSKRSSESRSASAGARKTSSTKTREVSTTPEPTLRNTPKESLLNIQSEHTPRRGDLEKVKEKRRVVSSRNLLQNNKHDRASSMRRSQTKNGSSSCSKDKVKNPSRGKRTKLTRTKKFLIILLLGTT